MIALLFHEHGSSFDQLLLKILSFSLFNCYRCIYSLKKPNLIQNFVEVLASRALYIRRFVSPSNAFHIVVTLVIIVVHSGCDFCCPFH